MRTMTDLIKLMALEKLRNRKANIATNLRIVAHANWQAIKSDGPEKIAAEVAYQKAVKNEHNAILAAKEVSDQIENSEMSFA